MIKQLKIKFSNLKLNVKIRFYYFIIVIMFSLVFIMFFNSTVKYNKKYNEIVSSAAIASSFSIDFKRDFDYIMYRIIIGSNTFLESDPYKGISDAQNIVSRLKNTSSTKGNINRAEAIQKYLNNLEKHVNKIKDNLEETGHYDENMNILDNDIRVVTSLIQDTILEYIYYETLEMESVRSEMESSMLKTMEISIIILSIMAIGGLFFSFIISNSISKPVALLSKITDQVAKGDLTVRSNITTGAEVKSLSDSLNIMIEKLSNLINTVKIEQSNLREAELKLLQEQINPHFLYNTLDTIIWLAESRKSEEVVDMVGSLSKYFRTALSKGKAQVTLAEEELHVRSYLEIQKIRYKDIMEYVIDIPKELLQLSIPKITLQPIIENALYHGIKNKRGKGMITIKGRREYNQVLLLVSDNGIGMIEDQLCKVRNSLGQTGHNKKEFFGLYNVNERIRLSYGVEYGIYIDSTYQIGTEVKICIPFLEETNNHKY